MSVGDSIKVHLPCETPWAIVTAELPDGRFMARIDNHTIGGLHGYKFGDVATFEADGLLAAFERQEKVGPRG